MTQGRSIVKSNRRLPGPNVIISAFACEPDEGSEPEVGWKWANVMAECCNITVVTQTKNRTRIDSWYESHPDQEKRVSYTYLELGPVWRWLKKHIPGGMYAYYAVWQWRLRSHVADLLRRQDFDLIHHVTFASFRMPVWAAGKPVIWGPVGGAETAPMHLLAGHGTFAGRLRELFRNLATRFAGLLLGIWEPTRRSGGIALASTPATEALLAKNLGDCLLMPTIGYDAIPMPPEDQANFRNDSLRLLFIGRLHLLKGLHLILQALSLIESRQVKLTIVGDGPERHRLRILVERLGLETVVTFLGHIPRARLCEVFASHDVIAAPSVYESGGLSVLEGFAHGLPAIVLDCGGHALSVDESCGFRIKISQSQQCVVKDLADAMRFYCDNRGIVAEHGNSARERLHRLYSWNEKQAAMQRIYQTLIIKSSS